MPSDVIRLGFLILTIGIVGAPGESHVEQQLELLRSRYESTEADATRQIRQRFVDQLNELEKKAVDAGDLDAAIAVRDKRLSVIATMKRFDPAAVSAREAQAITLVPESAERQGAVLLKQNELVGWHSAKSEATWNVRLPKPGRYEVELTLSCGKVRSDTSSTPRSGAGQAPAGGVLSILEDTGLTPAPSLQFEVLPFETWGHYRSLRIGVLSLTHEVTAIKIRCDEARGEGLMRLRNARLIPVFDPPRESLEDLPAVESLKAAFDALLRRRIALVDRTYLEALGTLASKAEGKLAETIRAEMENVEARLPPEQAEDR